ncbi:hypothetical protein [Deinococcus alpinitundrae]|uniref:hypothetical protein n=1 Tax=Deinococcus alpinitundrae TaxID=468913 RepID=UPI00137B4F94|nr:hypothetical protein [Deinococcus alpinitundrae]
MKRQHMILTEATLQAILELQQQLVIVGDPVVTTGQDGDSSVVTLKVQMPLPFFRLNKYVDLVYQTLEDTSTKTYTVLVEISLHEPLGWEDV